MFVLYSHVFFIFPCMFHIRFIIPYLLHTRFMFPDLLHSRFIIPCSILCSHFSMLCSLLLCYVTMFDVIFPCLLYFLLLASKMSWILLTHIVWSNLWQLLCFNKTIHGCSSSFIFHPETYSMVQLSYYRDEIEWL